MVDQETNLNNEEGTDITANIDNSQNEDTSSEEKVDTVESLKEQLAELNDKYLRLYADFDNFTKRNTRERLDLIQSAGKDIIVDLLPVLDDFERGLKLMETANDVNAVKEGVSLVYHKIKRTLEQKGLVAMESIGNNFDPDLHEAITNVPAPSDDLKNKIIDEIEKGYSLNEKVIRYAKVVVGN